MPRPSRPWTAAEVAYLWRGRAEVPPRPWSILARVLGVHRMEAARKARALGFFVPTMALEHSAASVAEAVRRSRLPPPPTDPGARPDDWWGRCLPPGHAVSWGSLTAGTALAGVRYPARS